MAHDYSTGGLSKNCLAYIVAAHSNLPGNVLELSASRGTRPRGGGGGVGRELAALCNIMRTRACEAYRMRQPQRERPASVGGGTPANRRRPLGYRPQAHVSDVAIALCAWMHHAWAGDLHEQAWGLGKGAAPRAEGVVDGRRL
jgi:hypothetical protein